MSFHNLAFIYAFLPASLLAFRLLKRMSKTAAHAWMIVASLVFYGLGDIAGLPVLVASIAFNFALGKKIRAPFVDEPLPHAAFYMSVGIALNVVTLAFFKYAHSVYPPAAGLLFPLALSFYTFSQISYLIELRTGKIGQPAFREYLLYILFFPKLIAGPIARPSEFLPQLDAAAPAGAGLRGLTFFFVGLFKKAAIADQLAPYADHLFALANGTDVPTFYHAWSGAIIYGLQLYFDFSGYTDMAIGVALLFGIALPVNFEAPYRSLSVTDFWRKWHMSLSYFFRDYVYIPLGGNRKGTFRKYLNLMIIMVLCGMWHGSAVTFVVWGAMHGSYLVIHNLWRSTRKPRAEGEAATRWYGRAIAWCLTFAAVTLAWVPFRADSLQAAGKLMLSMARFPFALPTHDESILISFVVLPAMLAVLLLPTTQSWMSYGLKADEPAKGRFRWKAGLWYGIATGCVAAAAILIMSPATTFIYKGF